MRGDTWSGYVRVVGGPVPERIQPVKSPVSHEGFVKMDPQPAQVYVTGTIAEELGRLELEELAAIEENDVRLRALERRLELLDITVLQAVLDKRGRELIELEHVQI